METVTKVLALVQGVDASETFPYGAFEVVLSAPTLDRDGEVIDSRAFEPLPDHIPFDIDHGMSVVTTVGSGAPYYAEDGTLRVSGGFASTPLAQEVRALVTEGHIRTTSVTFMSAERVPDEKGVPHVRHAELLNGTFTPVPSNRESVVLGAKNLEALEKSGARNNSKDAERLQQIHDLSVTNGASCVVKSLKALPADEGDPNDLLMAADAAIDEAQVLLDGVDTSTLPAEVQQALALIDAADQALDAYLAAQGLPDPDETPEGRSVTADAAPDAAEAASVTADAATSQPSAPDPAQLAKAIEARRALAFG